MVSDVLMHNHWRLSRMNCVLFPVDLASYRSRKFSYLSCLLGIFNLCSPKVLLKLHALHTLRHEVKRSNRVWSLSIFFRTVLLEKKLDHVAVHRFLTGFWAPNSTFPNSVIFFLKNTLLLYLSFFVIPVNLGTTNLLWSQMCWCITIEDLAVWIVFYFLWTWHLIDLESSCVVMLIDWDCFFNGDRLGLLTG